MRWAVLLAGGSGTRFWPLSTPENPKQLLPLAGSTRAPRNRWTVSTGLIPRERILVVAGAGLAARLRERLKLPPRQMLVEPRAASTAPALIWATWEARRRDPDAEVLSLHADWAVGDAAAFRRTADLALAIARRTIAWSPSAWCPRAPKPATATSCPGSRSTGLPGWSRDSPRSRRRHCAGPDGRRRAVEQRALRLDGRASAGRSRAHTPEVSRALPRSRAATWRASSARCPDLDRRRPVRAKRAVAVVPGAFAWDDVGTWQALTRFAQGCPGQSRRRQRFCTIRRIASSGPTALRRPQRRAGPYRRAGQWALPGDAERAGGLDEAAPRRLAPRIRTSFVTALFLLEPARACAWAPFAGVRPIAELRAGIWRIRERWEAAPATTPRRSWVPPAGFTEGDEPPVRPPMHDRRAGDRGRSESRRGRRSILAPVAPDHGATPWDGLSLGRALEWSARRSRPWKR